MNNIILFFNELSLHSGAIWLEDETIKLSTPKKLQNEETKNFVVNNKAQIISILNENNIFSKEKFLKVLIFKDNISNFYPLSPAQERLWFIEQYEQGSNAYHIPAVYELDVDADSAGIKYALQQIVSRHEVLRSTIEQVESGEHGIQRVHDEPLQIEELTLTDENDFGSLVAEDINRPFDLRTEYPIRVKFYHIQSDKAGSGYLNKSILLINTHHIASDGWSTEIFERELYTYYEAYINNDTGFSLPALEIQYKDYAVWQRTYLTGDILEKQLNYWKNKLSGFQTLELPTDYARPGGIDYSGSSQVFMVEEETSQKLRALAQRFGVTVYSVLLSSMNILLSKYTGQEDIITGSMIANRHHRQTEELIGFFANTQVNRTILNQSQSFEELILQVHQDQVEAQLYQDLPFEKLVDELGVERDSSRHPVFQVMFGIQDIGSQENAADQQKNYLMPFQAEDAYEVEKFDLSVFIYDGQQELIGQISYATALFHESTIETLIRHYTYLLEQLTEAPEQPYSQLNLLSPEEYEQIVYDWNATGNDYPEEKTVYQVFREQVEKTPDNIALVYEGQQLSYKQLNEKSNQLARHIREQFLQRAKQPLAPDTLIALYLDRSLEMVIGILAVLKAGGAYVPIDTNYPKERINYLLEDTQAELILSRRQLYEGSDIQLPPHKVINIDLAEKLYKEEDTSNLPLHNKAKDLAYVIYTSGTTGKPKGVMVEHASIISLVYNDYIQVFDKDVFAFLSSPVFDASTFEIWMPLLNGNTLIIPKEIKNLTSDIKEFINFLSLNNISILWLTKTLFESLFHFDNDIFKDLNYLIIGGEALDGHIVDKLVNSHTKPKHFLNGYGPTESTTFTCVYDLSNQRTTSNTPIGTPIKNRTTYVLYPNLNPVPIGIIGELYIGGAGLTRGYLNKKDLTEELLIPNPFATEADKAKGHTRLYKTGDLVRWLPDGNLEYIGRNDDQVKIRGFRIELGEIEHALLQITGIRQSCVLVKERKTASGSNKYLVGYYVSDNNADTLSQTGIADKLSQSLPEYMVPGNLVAMESFPLTINGKLDKHSLPDPDFSDNDNYLKPNTELETRLCQVYAEVLGLASDQISTHQNFFRMGGNSILSIQLKVKLNRLDEFNHISVADLFKYNSINKLIQSIQKDGQTEYEGYQNITQSNGHEIAIIGVSGAFSGANNIAELWQLIANQYEGIQFYSREECKQLGIDETLLEDPDFVSISAHVNDIELFDPFFWEMSPNDARLLDPQIRKFIEHCWFALESSGYAPQRKNQNIGVFAGSGYSNYFYDHILHGEMADQIDMWEASISNSKDALATKTAYLLGLSGPANSINTACSTGLVAVIEACKNLRLGTCNMALAGGVSLLMPDQIGYIYQEGMISSKDGHCRTFDKESSGTTGGSGVAVVLLKRLKDAIKDNDTIAGVIKGYATNNDGDRKTGYTAPSLIGQSECIINAQAMAGISPDQIDYVECHGTATHLGDPIEVQALREAFQYKQPKVNSSKHKTVLGAVKANIGHTDSAAGTAGLIKVVAMLQHNIIPGQVNYNEPNPEMQLDQTNFEIIKENRIWLPGPNKRRLAAVSSFGVGGTNAHVIIGDYIPGIQKRHEIREITSPSIDVKETLLRYIILISARSRQSLEHYKQALIEYLANAKVNNGTLRISDIAYTLEERRVHFNFRTAYCAMNTDELIGKLKGDATYAETNTENNNKVVLMFPGQGAQYTHMAKALYNNELIFKKTIDQCIDLANQNLNIDLFDVIYPLEGSLQYDINEIQWTPISLFIIEYALARYLEHLGVKADAYIGHSFGEYVAATLSGVFCLEDVIKVLIARGKLMQSMEPGSMLAINAKETAIKEIVKEYDCEIALINSPEDVVVSGTDKDIKALQEALEMQDIPLVKLNASVAGHSKLMDEAAHEFEKVFKDIKLNRPTKDFVSNVTGEIAGEEVTSAGYWSKQLRNTVQFARGINNLSRQYNHQISFIEVGTGKGLSYFVNKHKTSYGYKSIQTVQLLPSAKEAKAAIGDQAFQSILNKEEMKAWLWMNGIIQKANDPELFIQTKLQTSLPSYQFDYQKCWLENCAPRDFKKFNSLDEMFYERSWVRANLKTSPADIENLKHKSILVLVNKSNTEQNLIDELLDILNGHCDNLSYVIHQQDGNIKPGTRFDFSNASHIEIILNEKTRNNPIDLVIYISPSIDINNPGLDIFAVKNIFSFLKETANEIPEFISISFDNYEVIGNEPLQEKPSVVYGVTKSIPFEYFTSATKAFHLDLSAQDTSYKNILLPALSQIEEKDFFVIRGKYQWLPTYRQVNILSSQIKATNGLPSGRAVFLITGGLGGVGYAYADYLAQKHEKCTLILIGRTKESHLRADYKSRLAELRKTRHQIIYAAIDIGHKDASANLGRLLTDRNIDSIEVILHSAGIGAKSALIEKTREDIERVVNPKIAGVENLIKLGRSIRINNMVCCSSITSIIPALGNMEYTAANLYLDEISNRSHPGIKYMLSINLNQISDTGMAVDFMETSTSGEGMSSDSIRSYEFPGILEKLLHAKNVNTIALSRYDFNTLYNENTRLFDHLNDTITNINADCIKIIEDSYTETEFQIAQIFGDTLGIGQISIYDDFFRLGGNSIHAIHVSHRISKLLNCDVFVADLFKHKTINNIKDFLLTKKNNDNIIGQEIEI
ncbi:MAG: amino acid adenylation domain-containing protein [Ferruginibacter sp.]